LSKVDPAQRSGTSRTISQYASELASDAPTPGGGSAVAIVASLAASLGEMVCRFTGASADSNEEINTALARLGDLRTKLLTLSEEDERAYLSYARAARMAKDSEAAKSIRRAALDAALREAAAVPLSVAELTSELLDCLIPVASFGNKLLISDAEVAALLAEAALRGAIANVKVNARLMKQGGEALIARANDLEQRGRATAGNLLEIARAR